MNNLFISIIEIIGTSAFAISGIRLAAAKRFDWFGAYVVGLVTAIGGGTLRDLALGVTPFWMLNSVYLIVTAISLAAVIILGKRIVHLYNKFYIYDAIGLGLFCVVGIQKTLEMGFPFWVAITMGTVTGVAGGIIRDVLLAETPLIFRKDIYAVACIGGGLVYWVAWKFGFDGPVSQSIAAVVVILIRFLAVKFSWRLPTLREEHS
ncbi:trimeric intracellular cation channel family protein [Bacteroidales bacterium OttesenSCG-928-J19]|nr:trimeric intracellular cation channel family protein [Bacteroidales bacterium OttesenSCG-928-J19]